MAGRTLKNTHAAVLTNDVEIEVFGLGYVGFPLAVRLAGSGMNVTGVDVDGDRISRLKGGTLLDTEQNLKKAFITSRSENRLRLRTSPRKSQAGKVGFVCVPTPIPTGPKPSDLYVNAVVERFLETADKGDILVIESSIEVGTTDRIRDRIRQVGHTPGEDFGLAFCPERVDPQNTRWTMENIPRTIYCSDDVTYKIASSIYAKVNNSNLLRVSSAMVAEVTKSYENAFRLVNISLVNELAILCDHLGINVKEVISAASSKPFGFMPFYPGAGAGGHCIPKDPIFLVESSRRAGGEFKAIENALWINAYMPKYVASSIDSLLTNMDLSKSVLVYGMSYKPDIEDMRDSPGFKVAEELASMKYYVGVFDPFFKLELLPKYLQENSILKKRFSVVDDLMDEKFSCLCVVQHHSRIEPLLQDVYAKGRFPIIYDCQNRIQHNAKSTTVLRRLGADSDHGQNVQ